ncbi:MAG: TetR/AcrR family transcriptional regulator [Lachnospiraceae bacterium]|nr:TetR/AcrR family transcriptional regulator [Lachnospiraceae bacterium]
MGKIEDKKREKKEALLISAFALFTEKGIQNTSISEIVKGAKMAKGTFYLYYKDKFDIRDELIARQASALFDKANEELKLHEAESWSSLEEGIVALADHIADQLNENQLLLRFISKNLSWGIFSNIRIAGLDNRNCMDIFEDLLERSGRQFRQKHLMIYMIVELVNATCYNVILQEQPVTLEELKPDLNLAIRNLIKQFEVS